MNLNNLDLNLLKVLDALIAERSVTRAGIRLGRSQPAVSHALDRLRRLFGDELLVRGPAGLVLTSRAEALRGRVQEALQLMESCFGDAPAFDPATATGVFRLSTPDRLSLALMPPLLARMRKRAPGMALQVMTADREQALDLLDADRVDLALGWLDGKPGHFQAEFVMNESLFCVFRRDHPIVRRRGRFDITAVLSYPHLVVSATGTGRAIFDDLLARHGLRREALIAVTNFTVVPQLLRKSEMIGVFTSLAADVFRKSFGLARRPVPIDVGKVSTNMVWQARHDRDKKHQWLRAEIKAVYADLRKGAVANPKPDSAPQRGRRQLARA
ncbi:MAG TPA: LysR family transcriptional regulator [Xanthobacteraceae bacterium]|nr:LysR family transcriptional regulator [Xanthobacteraceae bacterium]